MIWFEEAATFKSGLNLFQVEYTGKIHEIAHVAREQVTERFYQLPIYEDTMNLQPMSMDACDMFWCLANDVFCLQRREYKSKFLEVETEASRTKDRLEMMNHILDEMQEKM